MSASLWTEPWHCRKFVRAGGSISASEWILLDEDEQDTLADAGEFVRAENAMLLLSAMRDPNAVLTAMMDDGARERAHLHELLDRAEKIEVAA